MFPLALSLCYAAWCLLCFGGKHHRAVFDAAPSPRRAFALRTLGWLGQACAFVLCVGAYGWEFGPIAWSAALMVTAIALLLLLPFAPRWALRTGGVAPAVGMLALLLL